MAVWKKIAEGIYLVGEKKTVYFRQMIDGKRETVKAKIQGALAVGGNGRPTADLLKQYRNWTYERQNRSYYEEERKRKGENVPTFEKLIELFETFAPKEFLKNGRPERKSQETTVKYFRYLVAKAGLKESERSDRLTTGKIDIAIADWIRDGKSRETAKTYAMSAKSITARWAVPMYATEGWAVKPYEMPVMRGRVKLKGSGGRYKKLKDETIRQIDELYEKLWHENMSKFEYKLWLFVTLVYKFDMRPNDTGRMTMENEDQEHFGRFVEHQGLHYLSYIPHKTSKTSGARVNWPVHPDYWARIEEAAKAIGVDADKPLLNSVRWLSDTINNMLKTVVELRERSKWVYELRKLDMHRTLHKFGAEKVAAKSGDAIGTILYFYADISWVDVDGMNLDDLK